MTVVGTKDVWISSTKENTQGIGYGFHAVFSVPAQKDCMAALMSDYSKIGEKIFSVWIY